LGRLQSRSLIPVVALALAAGVFIVTPAPAAAGPEEATVAPGPPAPSSATNASTEAAATGDAAELYRSGSSLRAAGIVFTVIGLGAVLVGASLVVIGAVRHAKNGEDMLDMGGAGIFVFVGGNVTLCVGIPMWGVGASRRGRARSMGYAAAYVQPFLAPTSGGLVAGLRLATF
jgi:hypothetical protein